MRNDHIWKSPELVKNYLSGTRLSFPGALQQIEVIAKIIEANDRQIFHLLDLGCGDGILGSIVLDKYPQCHGVFLDFSEDMLNAATKKLSAFGSRIELINYDYSNSDWISKVNHNAPYDLILSGYSIHHQPDNRKKEIYKEIFDLLDSKGLFLNIEHVSSASPWIGKIHDEYFIDSLFEYEKKHGSKNSREEVSNQYYNREDRMANKLSSVEDQCKWLEAIGFFDVDCFFKLFEFSVFGGRKI